MQWRCNQILLDQINEEHNTMILKFRPALECSTMDLKEISLKSLLQFSLSRVKGLVRGYRINRPLNHAPVV